MLFGGCPESPGIKWWATHLVNKNIYPTGVQIYFNNSPLRHTISQAIFHCLMLLLLSMYNEVIKGTINWLKKGKQTPAPKQYSPIVRPSPCEPCHWLMICTRHTLRHSLLQKKYPVSMFHISLFSKKDIFHNPCVDNLQKFRPKFLFHVSLWNPSHGWSFRRAYKKGKHNKITFLAPFSTWNILHRELFKYCPRVISTRTISNHWNSTYTMVSWGNLTPHS